MDPISYEHILYNLSHDDRRDHVPVPVSSLQVGAVLATTQHDRHVVISAPKQISAKRMEFTVRSLYGGHNLALQRHASTDVRIYRDGLHPEALIHVPHVPEVFVPDDPDTGDRIVMHSRVALSPAELWWYEYDGQRWTRAHTGDPVGDMRQMIGSTGGFAASAWFTYIPAVSSPFLYVDGRPTPARTVDELSRGDILRVAGGGRLRIADIKRDADACAITAIVADPSRYPATMGMSAVGAAMQFHDRVYGALYAVEPRVHELLSSPHLDPGDVVITNYDRYSSVIATVDYVRDDGPTAHLDVVTGLGTRIRITTDTDRPQFVRLQRRTVDSLIAA